MDKKYNRLKIFIVFALLVIFNPFIVNALEYPTLDSKIVEIYDLTDDKLIYDVNANEKTSIASLTKIVTTITAIENISNLDEKVTITNDILNTVRWDASRAGLKVNDKLTYRDLLYASILPSGADATNSLAILSSGSIEKFVEKMNSLVAKLDLKNTHFVNVTGLDEENHYSTADDIRKILSYALKNELFKTIYTTKEYELSNGLIVKSTLTKYNNSSIDTSKIIGSKTGFTQGAGYCLSSLSNINSHDFIIVVINANLKNNKYYNVVDTINLIEYLLGNYNYQTLVKKDDLLKILPIELSNEDNYEIHANDNVELYLPSDYDKNKLSIEYEGFEKLSFFNKENDKIGIIKYYYDNELIKEEEVKLETKLHISLKKIFSKYFYIFIIVPILIVIIVLFIRRRKINK